MQHTNQSNYCAATTAAQKTHRGILTVTALLFCGLAVQLVAQSSPVMKVVAEKGFTVAPDVFTPVVLRTQPDAVCDLHGEDENGNGPAMRIYANGDGYVKIQARPKEESQEARAQLDCASPKGLITRYPLLLRVGSSPTSDMPSPASEIPIPKGSHLQPGLTEAEAQQFSDDELMSRGYPPRPDSPEAYATWFEVVRRPSVHVDEHLVTHSDIYHHAVHAGVTDNKNWSGYVGDSPTNRAYSSVHGEWNMPPLVACENATSTYSAFWIGLDGYFLPELSQEGTEQDCYDIGGSYYTYYFAWTELLPNQPFEEQITGFSPNPGDYMYATLWIGNSAGVRTDNGSGAYVWYYVNDITQGGVYTQFGVKLAGTHFYGKTVEWVMERPALRGGGLAELSDYGDATMLNAQGFTTRGRWENYSALGHLLQLWLYNESVNGPGNDLLSSADYAGASTIDYWWFNWH